VSTAVAPTTTRTFVRLKLSLLRNGLRQSTGRTAAYVTSIVLALLLAAVQLLGLILLRGNAHAEGVVLPLAALLALGWAVMPLFFSTGDETLDPTRLVMLPLRPAPLVRALLAASLVGIGPVFTVTLALGVVLALAHGTAGTVAAVVALPLLVLVCVALARTVAAANVRLLTSRKGRDLALLSGLVIAVGLQFVNLGVQKLSQPGGLDVLEPLSDVLRWVPPASAVGAVGSASEGAYGAALAQLALTGVLLAVLLRWWQRLLVRLMTSPDSSTVQAASGPDAAKDGARTRRGDALARLLPAGRSGAVMERTLRYAWRDPKTKVAWVSYLFVGLLVPLVTALEGKGSVYQACWAAGLLGLLMYNQFGQDYSGFWLVAATISSPREAAAELRGRMLAIALAAVPYVVLATVFTAWLTGGWAALPEVLGLALTLLGALLATGTYTSMRFPYSIPQDNGFKNVAPGQGSLAYLSIFGGMLIGAVLSAPVLALTIWLHLAGLHGLLWLVLPVGVGYGLALPVLAQRLVAPRVVRRLPEILTAVSKG
jgi:ABC-2 type transport system permease protein